jgi:signal transduction histidine kinase
MTVSTTRELEFLRFLDSLGTHLRPMRDAQKALRHALRGMREFFKASHACVAVGRPGRLEADLLFAIPRSGPWDRSLLARFIDLRRPELGRDLLIAPLRRHGGTWGAMAFLRPGEPYGSHERRMMSRLVGVVSEAIQLIDQERMLGVRERIDRKVMEQIHPKDLFYQILDGLRTLTRYDHSSALLVCEEDARFLRLEAEQIAWTKAKSQRIGLRVALDRDARAALESGRIHGFDRHGDRWIEWNGGQPTPLAELLDYNEDGTAEGRPSRERSMLCAPLVTRDGVFGVLKVASRHPGALRLFDARLVDHFRSQSAVAIQNLNRAESLRERMLTAERKHAMAELARTVSHDVNNAIGSMLPLVQQMRLELDSGRHSAVVLLEDLEHVRKALEVCRRIFGGMLSFARGGVRRSGHGQIALALDTTLAILKDGMDRRGITLAMVVPDGLAPVACGQTDLEQIFLNLLTNAREASGEGDRVSVTVEPGESGVRIAIADTGCGILPEHMSKVFEPFFTTKPHGNGLGLSICRAIVWESGGELKVESEADRGTRVDLSLPWAATEP